MAGRFDLDANEAAPFSEYPVDIGLVEGVSSRTGLSAESLAAVPEMRRDSGVDDLTGRRFLAERPRQSSESNWTRGHGSRSCFPRSTHGVTIGTTWYDPGPLNGDL